MNWDILWAILPVIAALVVPLLGLLATPAGVPVLAWLIGNPVGRVVALIGLAIAAVWIAYRLGTKDGVARIEAQVAQRNLDALRDRVAIDEEIRAMPADKRREELSKWVR
ncbi:MAG: hypothetical protein ACRED4_00075 [Brevundimonas sp.]